MSVIEHLKQDAVGLSVLTDWFGGGLHPVPKEIADRRAAICLHGDNGQECPHLKEPNWWDRNRGAIAFAIKEQLEAKSQLKLETDLDANPRMCAKCGCCMPLKAWTPIEYIAAHTPESVVKNMPAFCWQRIEIENL